MTSASVSPSAPGSPVTSEPVALCSGAAGWSPQEPTWVCSHLRAPRLLSSFLPVALLILRVETVISAAGAVGASPALVPRLAGNRSLAVCLDSSEGVLCVSPAARTLPSVSSVLACELLSAWKCCREMGGRVCGQEGPEQGLTIVARSPSGPFPTPPLGVPPPLTRVPPQAGSPRAQAELFPLPFPFHTAHEASPPSRPAGRV